MQGDAGRCREMQGDAGRCRERTSSTSVPSRSSRTLVAATRAVATPATWSGLGFGFGFGLGLGFGFGFGFGLGLGLG